MQSKRFLLTLFGMLAASLDLPQCLAAFRASIFYLEYPGGRYE